MKLYVDEEGAEESRALSQVVVSALARVEVVAALWRKERIGELSAASRSLLTRAFEIDMLGGVDAEPRFTAVGVGRDLLEQATDMLGTHPLRAYDAIQLASALAARDADPSCARFACFDTDLRAAAAGRGFALVP